MALHVAGSDCCACPICSNEASGDPAFEGSIDFDPQMSPYFSDNQVVGQLNSGNLWASSSISYSFLQSVAWWNVNREGPGFVAFTPYQQQATRRVMDLWDDLITQNLVEVDNTTSAQIDFSNSNYNVNYAHAYQPGRYLNSGEVWLNAPRYNGLYSPDPGDYYFMTILHEVGHALGLNHPGAYNGGSPTYSNDAVYAQDTHQWTVMSYFNASNTGADWNGGTGWQYAQTPMVHDVLAIQAMYGADTNTRTGSTVYGFNSNTENSLFDFSTNQSPVLTIYDAGGNDTLDLSGFAQRAIINLAPGSYSSAGGVWSSMTYNIGIAANTVIENAIGGSHNDTIYGNSADNLLSGGGGNDLFYGYAGNDQFRGGSGIDWVYFSYSFLSYTITLEFDHIKLIGEGQDQVYNDVEHLAFSDVNFTYANLASNPNGSVVENDGDYALKAVGGLYFIESDLGERHYIRYGNSPIDGSTNPDWTIVAVEGAEDTGFELLWSQGSQQWRIWDLDATANYSGSRDLDAFETMDQETSFNLDLNGDGRVGNVYTILESNSSHTLQSDLLGRYSIVDSGLTQIGITYKGTNFNSGSIPDWKAIQVEDDGVGGFTVLLHYAPTNLFALWNLDGAGYYQSSSLLTVGQIYDAETLFATDLNGDNVVGHVATVLEANGEKDLLLQSTGQYLIRNSDGSLIGISFKGAAFGPNTIPDWKAVQIEEDGAGGYTLLLHYSPSNVYAYWNLNAAGAYQSSSSLLSEGEIYNAETKFGIDLNGDTVTGHVTTVLETNGDHDLLVKTPGQYLIRNAEGATIGLRFKDSAFGPNSIPGWKAVQAEADGTGGYTVLLHYAAADVYAYWNVDGAGKNQSSPVIAPDQIYDAETLFGIDLNGDTLVGHATTVLETNGDHDLLVKTPGQYLIRDAEGATIGLRFKDGAFGPDSIPGWKAVQAEADGAGGYTVLLHYAAADVYAYWNVDGAGVNQSSPVIAPDQIYDAETLFGIDLNGDTLVGHATTVLETNGDHDLLVKTPGQYLIRNAEGATIGLRFKDGAFGPDSIPGWKAVQAEADGTGGYTVLLHYAAADVYAYWNVDGAGVNQSSPVIAPDQIHDAETLFDADLNADQIIGHGSTILESNGDHELLFRTQGQYAIRDNADTTIGLVYRGVAFGPDSIPGWRAIQAEDDGADGFNVLLYYAPADVYALWHMDSTGTYLSSRLLDPDEIPKFENDFQHDIDGDGTVGAAGSVPEDLISAYEGQPTPTPEAHGIQFVADADPALI